MELEIIDTTALINNALQNGYSYTEYRELVEKLLERNLSTGNDPKNVELLNYSQLNNSRMKRLDKTIKIDPIAIQKIEAINTPFLWLVLTESWCGDAGQSIPVINKLAILNDKINFKIVLRDENESLMSQFLTNGGQAIPKLIIYNTKTKKVINSWGPRPTHATKMVNNYKEANGKLTLEFKEGLQKWYNKDKGIDIVNDILNLIEGNK